MLTVSVTNTLEVLNVNSGLRVGIDVGGTFTDLVAFDEERGETVIVKLPSTPRDPSVGVLAVFKYLKERTEREVSLFVHASTIGSNLFLGQLGLRVPRGALVTTSGFRDVLEIGRQRRVDLYDPFFERPKPLIERSLRFGVGERMDSKGETLKPVDEEELRTIGQRIRGEGIETVAIVFLHSYANPEHEIRAKEILTQELPGTVIVASHEVDPEYREYERTSTTVVNSLLVPIVSEYLKNIGGKLKMLEVDAPFYAMQSNGGLAGIETASKVPVATIESGPATGVIASAYWSRLLGLDNVLSFDMGGTTAKAGAVIKGAPQITSEYEVGGRYHGGRLVKGAGYPVHFPFIDLVEVGAGGGTIAWVDEAKVLRAGPLSAGADPGPACYGRGGDSPTVTDANLVLGRLNPRGLSGGEIEVFTELAERALNEKVAEPLGISLVQAASGVLEIVNNHMMRALRLVSIERGYDPRRFAMIAFGGAGPMHAPFLAEGLGIGNIIVPPNSGVFSALGLIMADFRHDFIRSVMKQASEVDHRALGGSFKDMEEEAIGTLREEGFTPELIVTERMLDLRYMGQSYELAVPMSDSLEDALESFHSRHREMYGYAVEDEPVEVVNARLVARGLTGKPEFKKGRVVSSSPHSEVKSAKRKVFFERTDWMDTPIYSRDELVPGVRIEGPLIIEQYDATTVVPPGWHAHVDELSNICLRKGDD